MSTELELEPEPSFLASTFALAFTFTFTLPFTVIATSLAPSDVEGVEFEPWPAPVLTLPEILPPLACACA